MGAFIIDPKGKKYNVADGIHIDYFAECFLDYLKERQMAHFLKVLHITPKQDTNELKSQFENTISELIDDANYQGFYAGASEIGYLCGNVDDVELHLRMTDFDCVTDSQVGSILEILIKKKIKKIHVDFVDPTKDYVRSEVYSQNSFIEHL